MAPQPCCLKIRPSPDIQNSKHFGPQQYVGLILLYFQKLAPQPFCLKIRYSNFLNTFASKNISVNLNNMSKKPTTLSQNKTKLSDFQAVNTPTTLSENKILFSPRTRIFKLSAPQPFLAKKRPSKKLQYSNSWHYVHFCIKNYFSKVPEYFIQVLETV